MNTSRKGSIANSRVFHRKHDRSLQIYAAGRGLTQKEAITRAVAEGRVLFGPRADGVAGAYVIGPITANEAVQWLRVDPRALLFVGGAKKRHNGSTWGVPDRLKLIARVGTGAAEVKVYKNAGTGEFVLKLMGAPERQWYYTDDKADAIGTAADMSARMAQRKNPWSKHTHRAVPKKQKIRGYTTPVKYPQNSAAHGNVCVHDYCACGASRATNVNGRHIERGPWRD